MSSDMRSVPDLKRVQMAQTKSMRPVFYDVKFRYVLEQVWFTVNTFSAAERQWRVKKNFLT